MAYKSLIKEVVSFLNPNIKNLDSQIDSMYNLEKELAMVIFLKYIFKKYKLLKFTFNKNLETVL
jgi:hypothetical protein